MKRTSVLGAMSVIVVLAMASPAFADTTYRVPRVSSLRRIAREHGVALGELMAANPGKYRGVCVSPNEYWTLNARAEVVYRCRRIDYRVWGGVVLTIPEPRRELVERAHTLENEAAALHRERDRLAADIASEQIRRGNLEKREAALRKEQTVLSMANTQLREEIANTTTTNWLLFALIGVGGLVLILMFVRDWWRKRRATPNFGGAFDPGSPGTSDREYEVATREAMAAARDIELTKRARELDQRTFEISQVQAVLAAQNENLEREKAALELQSRALEARRTHFAEEEIPRLKAETQAADDARISEAVKKKIELNIDLLRLEIAGELRPVIREEIAGEMAERERAFQESSVARETEIARREQWLGEREKLLKEGWGELEAAGLVRPRQRTPTQPILGEQARKAAASGEIEDMTDDLEEEPDPPDAVRTELERISRESVFVADPCVEHPECVICRTKDCNEHIAADRVSDHAAKHREAHAAESGEHSISFPANRDDEKTKEIELEDSCLVPYTPVGTIVENGKGKLWKCECGADPMDEESWEMHQEIPHLKCMKCGNGTIILGTRKRRHLKRHDKSAEHAG